MSVISYPYFQPLHAPMPRPYAICIAVNTLNKKSAEFLGVLDSGADGLTLTADLANNLGIDLEELPEERILGVHGIGGSKYCDFISVGLFDTARMRHYFPGGKAAVPAYFSASSPSSLLGRRAFLDLSIVTFDGPKQIVHLDFK